MAEDASRAQHAVPVGDDEPLLLLDAMDRVEEAGFKAYGAFTASEAIRLLELHPEIRVLFTDIHMPGSMDGLKLAHAVRKRWPPVVVMVTSGRIKATADDLPEHGMFIAKPYPPSSVIRILQDLSARMAC